ncbi:aquaporin 1 [Pyronema domesticum]|nr:aquaporin 1 [Pyronema domesticum]CCX09528.1 Similar to Aquaporin-2; acc. no. P0CD89 [Pyronema omphalodes CBS 100304]
MAGKNRSSTSTTPIADESGLSGRRMAHNSPAKNLTIAVTGEFIGTFMFLGMAYMAVQAVVNAYTAEQSISKLLYIAFAFAVSLTVNVWLFYRVSGGLFNPSLTLAFVLLRLMPPMKGALLIAAQLLGGIAAAGVAQAITPGTLNVETTLGTGVSTAQGFFIEAILTAELCMAVLMIAVEKHRATFMAPLVIGCALGIGHLVGISFTGASMNPARSFGPAVVSANFEKSHWIYWIAPSLGAAAAAGIYKLLLVVDYTTSNPGQDSDGSDIESRGTVFIDETAGEGRA